MIDISDMYEELILDHAKSPQNFKDLPDCTHSCNGKNPMCGDFISLKLKIKDNNICEAAFLGDGCAISKASSSLMTQSIMEKNITQVRDLAQKFLSITKDGDEDDFCYESLGKLAAFKGVKKFPSRVKCANLCWHALLGALDKNNYSVTSE